MFTSGKMEERKTAPSIRERPTDDFLDRLYGYLEQSATQLSNATINNINMLLNEAERRQGEFSESEMRQLRFIIQVMGGPLFERLNRIENTVQRISTEYSIGAMAEEIVRNNKDQIVQAVTERLRSELRRTRISPQDMNNIVEEIMSDVDITKAISDYIERTPLDDIFVSNEQLQKIVDNIIRMVETVIVETMNDVDSSFVRNP